ncbi:transporter substrate-binding domain-containing protein [Rhizobium sp. L1K21]|uniref:transporter substrate-binding domain-containing protein n=1 Tax=Rhizobium sp. L1K21 TaxID=2954933 RepID=UPI002093FD19|nr:transporter substrate-binding domain-containing protein [Rhizobium sp. L1K21]MCO6186802.1 transporter substrate-binding domain-containing protein [Rhizobium sp. L1K21]
MKLTRRNFSLLGGAGLAMAAFGGVVPAMAAGTLDDIKARGSLRVGVTQAPPWYSKDPATGEWTSGVGVSAGKAMAEALGVKFEPVEVTWGTAVAALQSNKIDIMFVLDATDERKQAADFPETPLLYYSLAVLAKDDLVVTSWEDLNKPEIKISVPQATSMDKFLTENVGDADIQRFPGNTEAIAAFQSGRVDAVCLFHPPLIAARQKLGYGKIVVPTPVKSNPTSAAVRKGDSEFVAFVDGQLKDYYTSGKIQTWYEEFLSGFGLDPKSAPPIIKERL